MKNRAKIAFFCQKICIIQKKAVPLHSLLKRRKNCPKSAQAMVFEIANQLIDNQEES